jgi:hypothetical protein
VSDIIYVQWLGCRLYRSIDNYTNRLTILPLAVSSSMHETTTAVMCAISTIIKTNKAPQALVTLCRTATRIDHYCNTLHKYVYTGTCDYAELVSIGVALIHLQPVLKIIRHSKSVYKISLQIYAKKQLWLPDFHMDLSFVAKIM